MFSFGSLFGGAASGIPSSTVQQASGTAAPTDVNSMAPSAGEMQALKEMQARRAAPAATAAPVAAPSAPVQPASVGGAAQPIQVGAAYAVPSGFGNLLAASPTGIRR